LLTRNHRQEGLCRAYVQAIAARCGMSTSLPSPDYGIDITLNDIAITGRRRYESGYKIDVQAKSEVRREVVGEHFRYDLDARTFDLLRHAAPGCPRILVVLLLPRDEAQWTKQTEEALTLHHCAYWLSLKGQGPTRNRRSVRLQIPRRNVFSVEAVAALMSRYKAGEEL
jgi:hypothetical protein